MRVRSSGLKTARACVLALLLIVSVTRFVEARFNHGNGASPQVFTGMGDPLPGIARNQADLKNFSNGLLNFKEVETLNDARATNGPPGGLGPVFNNVACAACHDHPTSGGGGLFLRDIRVRNAGDGAPPVPLFAVDNMRCWGATEQKIHVTRRF